MSQKAGENSILPFNELSNKQTNKDLSSSMASESEQKKTLNLKRSRKSIAFIPNSSSTLTGSRGSSTDSNSASRVTKKVRSKSLGPGGLDVLNKNSEGSGTKKTAKRRESILPASAVKGILKAPLPLSPAEKVKRQTSNLLKSDIGVLSLLPDANPTSAASVSSVPITIPLRTEEEQEASRRRAAEREQILAQRAERRKSIANRRVSFALEATLHTWDIEYGEGPSTPSTQSSSSKNSTPASNGSSARPSGNRHSTGSDFSTPAKNKYDVGNDYTLPTPGQRRSTRRSSGATFQSPAGNSDYSVDDNEEFSSSPIPLLNGDDNGLGRVIQPGEDIGGDSDTSESDNDGTFINVEDSTQNITGRSNLSTLGTVDEADDVTMDIVDDNDTRGLQSYFKKPITLIDNTPDSKETKQRVAPLPQHPTQQDDEGDKDMDLTAAVGGLLPAYDGDAPMDFTRTVGGFINAKELSPKKPSPCKFENIEKEEQDMTMNLTRPVGGFIRTEPLAQQLQATVSKLTHDDRDDKMEYPSLPHDDEQTMDITAIIGTGVIKMTDTAIAYPILPSAVYEEDDGEKEIDMDMTRALGGVINTQTPKSQQGNDDEGEMEMDLTTCCGGFMEPEVLERFEPNAVEEGKGILQDQKSPQVSAIDNQNPVSPVASPKPTPSVTPSTTRQNLLALNSPGKHQDVGALLDDSEDDEEFTMELTTVVGGLLNKPKETISTASSVPPVLPNTSEHLTSVQGTGVSTPTIAAKIEARRRSSMVFASARKRHSFARAGLGPARRTSRGDSSTSSASILDGEEWLKTQQKQQEKEETDVQQQLEKEVEVIDRIDNVMVANVSNASPPQAATAANAVDPAFGLISSFPTAFETPQKTSEAKQSSYADSLTERINRFGQTIQMTSADSGGSTKLDSPMGGWIPAMKPNVLSGSGGIATRKRGEIKNTESPSPSRGGPNLDRLKEASPSLGTTVLQRSSTVQNMLHDEEKRINALEKLGYVESTAAIQVGDRDQESLASMRRGAEISGAPATPERLNRRHSSGVGIDKPGLGSPAVTAVLRERKSISEATNSPAFDDMKQSMAFVLSAKEERARKELDERKAIQQQRELERQLMQKAVDQTIALKERIESMTPKKSSNIEVEEGSKGRKRTTENFDEDPFEIPQATKRRSLSKGDKPEKSVSVLSSTSHAPTLAPERRLTRSRASLEAQQRAKSISPAQEAASVAKPSGRVTRSRASLEAKGKASSPNASTTLRVTSTSTALPDEEEDEHLPKMTMAEFFDMINISFLDNLNTTRRRDTVAIGAFRKLTSIASIFEKKKEMTRDEMDQDKDQQDSPEGISYLANESDPTLSDWLVAATPTFTVLAMLMSSCQDMRNQIAEGRHRVKKIEKIVFKNNPPLFKEYILAPADIKLIMDAQFRNAQSYATLEAKKHWYEWRAKLLGDLNRGMEKHLGRLKVDEEVLKKQKEIIDKWLPELSKTRDELIAKKEKVVKRRMEVEQCDQEQLRKVRERLEKVKREVDIKKALLARRKEESTNLEKGIGEKEEYVKKLKEEIEEAEKIKEMNRGFSEEEVWDLRESVRDLEARTNFSIFSVQNSLVSFIYKNQLMVTLSASSPLANEILPAVQYIGPADAAHHTTFIPKILLRRPIATLPTQIETQYFLQLIQFRLSSLKEQPLQGDASWKSILLFVARSWDIANKISYQIGRMRSRWVTTCSINSTDSNTPLLEIVVKVMIPESKSKLLVEFSLDGNQLLSELEQHAYSSSSFSIENMECGQLVQLQARLVYGGTTQNGSKKGSKMEGKMRGGSILGEDGGWKSVIEQVVAKCFPSVDKENEVPTAVAPSNSTEDTEMPDADLEPQYTPNKGKQAGTENTTPASSRSSNRRLSAGRSSNKKPAAPVASTGRITRSNAVAPPLVTLSSSTNSLPAQEKPQKSIYERANVAAPFGTGRRGIPVPTKAAHHVGVGTETEKSREREREMLERLENVQNPFSGRSLPRD